MVKNFKNHDLEAKKFYIWNILFNLGGVLSVAMCMKSNEVIQKVISEDSENLEDASNQWVMRKSKAMHPVPVFSPIHWKNNFLNFLEFRS